MKKLLFVLFILISYNAVAQVSPNCFSNVTFAGSYSSSVTTMKKVLADPGFSAGDGGCFVLSFTVTVLPKRGEALGPFKIEGDRLDAKTIAQLRNIPGSGARIYLDKIVGNDHTSIPKPLPSFTLSLSE